MILGAAGAAGAAAEFTVDECSERGC
jgi:hypothetical protein